MNTTEKIVFERGNKQVIQSGNQFFTRVLENDEYFESGDFNTLERAKENLDLAPTTTEKNKIIAEFLGLELEETLSNTFVYARHEQNNPKKESDVKTNFYDESELLYHFDWNWLMEVVEKIKQKYCFADINISTGETSISIFDIDAKNHFTTCPKNNYEGATMLSVTYKAVVTFIEWSNEQNDKI